LRPTATALAGSLAVAAITATALSLFHELDATLMILIWNLGFATLMVGTGSLCGRRMFSWVAPRPSLHRDCSRDKTAYPDQCRERSVLGLNGLGTQRPLPDTVA